MHCDYTVPSCVIGPPQQGLDMVGELFLLPHQSYNNMGSLDQLLVKFRLWSVSGFQ